MVINLCHRRLAEHLTVKLLMLLFTDPEHNAQYLSLNNFRVSFFGIQRLNWKQVASVTRITFQNSNYVFCPEANNELNCFPITNSGPTYNFCETTGTPGLGSDSYLLLSHIFNCSCLTSVAYLVTV